MLYGLCGNATVGLQSRTTRLVIPRAHDCCTILLGSKELFQQHFGDNPSQPFGSIGYLERGDYFLRTECDDDQIAYGDPFAALVEKYGKDNAQYIWEQMHPTGREPEDNRVAFIEIPETAHLGAARQFRQKAAAEGKECLSIEGSLKLIRNAIDGDWSTEEFLIVEPGQQTTGIYDGEEIIRAEPGSTDKTD